LTIEKDINTEKLLRLREPHQGRHEEQADTGAGGDAGLGSRLPTDGHTAGGVGQEKSRTRCRVEHIFGFMENTMHRLYIRTVGLARVTAVIGLINLTYNMSRYEQIGRLNLLKK